MQGLDEEIHHFNKNGINITWLHLDNEFKCIKTEGEKRWNLKINLSAPDEHVPDVEQLNCTLEDRF